MQRVLFLSALLIATCGLVYELVAGALASYLLGDSVTQFSLIIGVYLSALGLGAWLSRFIDRSLLSRFVEIELAVALVGGFEAPILFAAFVQGDFFRPALFGMVLLVGTLVGLELPLLLRILESQTTLKELVARVLFLDYVGALLASLAFPLLALPHLGLFKTSLVFGLVNAGVALWTTFLFESPGPVRTRLRVMSLATLAILLGAIGVSGQVERELEARLFADPVVLSLASPYQRVVVTHYDQDTRLFLNGALQFSSTDEYRYHEALVHPALAAHGRAERVLVLGGGDGLAVREVLRWEGVAEVTLVDLDPLVTELFTERAELVALNEGALSDPRVEVVNADAFTRLRAPPEVGADGEPVLYDAVIIDFPDPSSYSVGKLYTNHFYRLLRRHLAPEAVVSMQATSPLWSPEAYWCIVRTLEHEGFEVRPYHAYVPAFGEWGFVLAGPVERDGEGELVSGGLADGFVQLPPGLRFLTRDTLPTLFHFPKDMARLEGPINRLDNQVIVRLYESDWRDMVER